ncbi:unnamed protein product, partial [Polarella glacialis]
CQKGTACEFAHGRQDMQRSPDLRHTSMCKLWMEGRCKETAQACRYAHGASLLRRTSDYHQVFSAPRQSTRGSTTGSSSDFTPLAALMHNAQGSGAQHQQHQQLQQQQQQQGWEEAQISRKTHLQESGLQQQEQDQRLLLLLWHKQQQAAILSQIAEQQQQLAHLRLQNG